MFPGMATRAPFAASTAAAAVAAAQAARNEPASSTNPFVTKKINDEKDVIYFKTNSPAYNCIVTYIDRLCERIAGTSNKVFNKKYSLADETFKKIAQFFAELEKLCAETNLDAAKGSGSLRFGHVAYRDWYDGMQDRAKSFINNQLAPGLSEQFREELCYYFTESFGNRMRIDYGTGHELNFLIFTMGLSCLLDETTKERSESGEATVASSTTITADKTTPTADEDKQLTTINSSVTPKVLTEFVKSHGWDIICLFVRSYLRLCRHVQTKFRLEPAGSRGVYNIDDYQFLPFLLGAAQLVGVKYVSTQNFYDPDQVDMFKGDFIFLDAVDFILNNKRGPFNEHSYTLWGFTNLGSWEKVLTRILAKFKEEVLSPLPVVQHILFGEHILRWDTTSKVA